MNKLAHGRIGGMVGVSHCEDCSVEGIWGEGVVGCGLEIINSKRITAKNTYFNVRAFDDCFSHLKVGRNSLCPCGSNVKYKRCHGRGQMAIGIRSSNSSTTFTNTEVVTDGIGLDLNNDKSTFVNTKIYARNDAVLLELASNWGLPENTPLELIAQAIEDGKEAKVSSDLDKSKLKAWMVEQGLYTVGYWTAIAVSIMSLVK